MGCGTSRSDHERSDLVGPCDTAADEGDLKLPYSRITVPAEQLIRLNEKFASLVEAVRSSELLRERQAVHVGVVVERLVQRLLCNVGTMDPRFSSKFLISLQTPHSQVFCAGKRLSFKYLIRLDALSTPALYPEWFEPPVKVAEGAGMDSLPQGYARVRLHGEYLEEWSEFINPCGFLRRDKIQERFIELLARAAACPTEPSCPAHVDESRLCGSPGKIVDPITLHHILKLPATQHVFYGAAECNESRFPDPRDFRIAIVEGMPETRLHISFLSPTAQTLLGEGDLEIVLTVGVGTTGWPVSSDFPSRYPLDHVDVILGYQAAQMDYYVVPRGPHHSVRCEDRNTIWEIRALATEMFLEYHYSSTSAVGRIFKVLSLLLESLRARGVKIVNRYILKNLILFELETRKRIGQWTPNSISRRVLSILDYLLSGLRNQFLPSYLFKRKNLLLSDNALEEDYASDGDILEHYLRQLSHDGVWRESRDACYVTVKDQLENVMLEKWSSVVSNLLPPVSNRGRRLSGHLASIGYTRRQMEYVALLFREVLKLRHIQQKQGGAPGGPGDEPQESGRSLEDFIFLLQIMFGQARQRACSEAATSSQAPHKASCDVNRNKFKLAQTMRSYDVSTSMLVDDLRRNRKQQQPLCDDADEDMNLVAEVIECLYSATDSDSRVLGPVLRPYLNQIFKGSHENCWFLPEWKKKTEDLEFRAIGAFSSLVLSGDIDPVSGILDSANKGWNWAKSCIRILRSIRKESSASVIIGDKIDSAGSGLRLIFTPAPNETVRFTVALPETSDPFEWEDQLRSAQTPASTLKSTAHGRRNRLSCYATIRSYSGALQDSVTAPAPETQKRESSSPRAFEKEPPHAGLRDSAPFSLASMEARRRGSHRGLGSIVQALISLQKLTVLQEISQFLPQEEKRKVLNDIKKLSKEVQRLTVNNYRRRNLPSVADDGTSKSWNAGGVARWKSATLPVKTRNFPGVDGPEKERGERYRFVSDVDVEAEEEKRHGDAEKQEAEAEDEEKDEENTLVGTCRLLRRHERQRIFGARPCERSPAAGRLAATCTTMPAKDSTINTPFYLRVATFERGREASRAGRRRRKQPAADFMQF